MFNILVSAIVPFELFTHSVSLTLTISKIMCTCELLFILKNAYITVKEKLTSFEKQDIHLLFSHLVYTAT